MAAYSDQAVIIASDSNVAVYGANRFLARSIELHANPNDIDVGTLWPLGTPWGHIDDGDMWHEFGN